ncbi:cytochrome C [Nonlabens sp. MB-3u-79]|uniref:c-type cytochrome n=1 Tax=Nonlabens sp. MB-3u-79 TaxID=2058134 RepID=UPI000C3164FC|nr:c-type cytochrome [Nonlabens sp. MB-3u-79]AUC78438.1 cytochrome C [Nonlabens sp. MB-3u-79]|tara:strand:- start:91521 stop:92867 length:1347 start_codon:yes stop_codon:yes gene_type:complete
MINRKLHFSAWQFLLAFVFVTLNSLSVYGQQDATTSEGEPAVPVEAASGADATKGEELFKANCASCHKLYKKQVGPALYGVSQKYEKEWLYKWITNSTEFIASGDARANAIYNEYNQSNMNAFPQLSTVDIDNILAYTDTEKPAPVVAVAGADGAAVAGSGDSSVTNNLILGGLALVLLLLVALLIVVNKTLRRFAEANGIQTEFEVETEVRTPLWKAFVQNQFLVLVTAVFLLLGSAYFGYGALMSVGVDQGYAPVQPIHYSHRIHAGTSQIECKYCHSSARESKHSGIPSLNVCMNCHKSIAEVAQTTYQEGMDEYGIDYNKEIEKLYAATGWDTDEQAFVGEEQPVRWVRIHNLPDLAYFNHAQHVTVGKIDCQTCHGPVEEMEVMYQYSPLTMGWCINCHRETNVDLQGNGYYEKIHKELSEARGGRQLTIADLGGLECGKCHY